MVALLGGSITTFAVPALFGLVVDGMKAKDWDIINYYCIIMVIIVVVSAISAGIRATLLNTMS